MDRLGRKEEGLLSGENMHEGVSPKVYPCGTRCHYWFEDVPVGDNKCIPNISVRGIEKVKVTYLSEAIAFGSGQGAIKQHLKVCF